MTQQIKVRSAGRPMSWFHKVPWSLLLIAYMLVVHQTKLSMAGATGYVFLALCIAVLFAEFIKSGDIGTLAFLVDLIGAVGALILSTALLCYLQFKLGEAPTFFHWVGFAVILGDATISPFNAFRTALRNVGLGVEG